MNTKTFQAVSVQEAIRQARKELGPDAMLLSSKRVPQGKGQPDHFAVNFAYHGDALPKTTVPPDDAAKGAETDMAALQSGRGSVSAANTEVPATSAGGKSGRYGLARKVHSGGDAYSTETSGSTEAADAPPPRGTDSGADEESRIPAGASHRFGETADTSRESGNGNGAEKLEAGESFDKLREQMLSLRREMLQLAGSVRRVSSSSYRQELPNDAMRFLYDLLLEQEFHADLIERILEKMTGAFGNMQLENPSRRRGSSANRKREGVAATIAGATPKHLLESLQEAIASYVDLMPEPGLRRKRSSPLVISLVGPPGAGKTTTLVKLAVRYGEASRFPLQIISMDNFRVGASEQLRAYAAVLGVGFDTLTTATALEKAIREYSAKEIILVDTPGLGWRDFDAADELSSCLRSLDNAITHMVAPASMKPSDFERLADLYEAFEYQSLVYTKLDETTSIGQLVSESWRRQKPLSYFTTGQRIPDDLELASRDRICERILPADTLAVTFAA